MPKKFKCPGCGTIVQAPDSAAGKNVKCPKCATIMKVPGQPNAGQQRPASQQRSTNQQQAPAPPDDPFGSLPDMPASTSTGGVSSAFPGPSTSGQNPYAQNPYASPRAASTAQQTTPGNPLMAPGIILCVLGSITVLLSVLQMVLVIVGAVMVVQQGNAGADVTGRIIGQFVGNIIMIIVHGTIAYGGYCATKLEKKSTVQAALILSVIPLCSPCLILGIPFGIWGLVVKPQVESRFRS